MSGIITLRSGDARCQVAPAAGGSLCGWWVGDWPILRPSGDAALAGGEAPRLSGFPLIPYSNRIGDARFAWQGRQVALRLNRAGESHALHGVGWQRPWQLCDRTETTARMQLAHCGDADWPWPFLATQGISLDRRSLTVTLDVRNESEGPAPLAAGYHPYFNREGARITLAADHVWLNGLTHLPERRCRPDGMFDLSTGADAASVAIDNCYQGVRWPARIAWPGCPLTLVIAPSSSLPHAVVYVNGDADALCIEPVAHVSNALNMAESGVAMPVVEPGQSFTCAITMTVSEAAG